MPNINNPAGRLYKLLLEIKEEKSRVNLRTTLARSANCYPKETATIYYFLSETAKLADETIVLVKKLEGIDTDDYVASLTKIRQALLSTSLDINTKSFATRILNNGDMLSVRACGDMLTTIYPVEKEITEKELIRLQKDIDSLMSEIVKVRMPDDLKIFLLNYLEKIRRALIGYKIYGNQGLKTALESAIGATYLEKDFIQKEREGKGKKVIENFFTVIHKTSEVLSLAEKVKSLAGPAIITLLNPPQN